MNNYIIKTMSGTIIKVTEKEYEEIRTYKSGLIHLRSGKSFNASSVDSIIPERDYLLEKAEKNKGVLHDGQKVIKKFGRWYLEGDETICMDPQYYEEIAQDCVPTLEEFNQKYANLLPEERLQLMLSGSELKRDIKQLRSGEGLTKA